MIFFIDRVVVLIVCFWVVVVIVGCCWIFNVGGVVVLPIFQKWMKEMNDSDE